MTVISEVQFKNLQEDLKRNEPIQFVVSTGSMEPVILVGDSIEVKPIKDDLKRFDIIVYWNENRKILICHYFWSKNQESYLNDQEPRIITRPLKSKREDFPIMQSRILGKVVNKKIPFSLKLRIIAHTLWQKK